MRLVCISDTHTKHKDLGPLPDGDVLIHAGDWTYRGGRGEIKEFLEWLDAQPHRHKIFIAGNHEFTLDRDHPKYDPVLREMVRSGRYDCGSAENCVYENRKAAYLENSGIEIEGVTFWGSPYTPAFNNWGFPIPYKDFWSQIPTSTQVLITHGPAFGMRDQVGSGSHLGSRDLAYQIDMGLFARAHVFGHIHDSYGITEHGGIKYVNASSCNEAYRCVNRPLVIDLE